MDDTNHNHDGEAESIPLEPVSVESGVESDADFADARKTAHEETEFEKKDDFKIGIAIEDMQAVEPGDSTHRDHPETDPVLSAITSIDERLVHLSDLFETKIKVDNHKNKVIDNLHSELQTFRDGVIKKQFYSFVTDVIKVIDDVRKFKRHYDGMPPTAENMDSLLNFLEGIACDIEDLFSWQGVVPFCCEEGVLDTSRQRVINKIECDDPAKDRMVAESIRPGYEWDGRVIRPEMVSVYTYTNKNGQEDTLADGKTY